jgi:hypothetical protein
MHIRPQHSILPLQHRLMEAYFLSERLLLCHLYSIMTMKQRKGTWLVDIFHSNPAVVAEVCFDSPHVTCISSDVCGNPYCWQLNTVVTDLGSGFGGLGVSMLTSGTQDRGFKPGRSRRIFFFGRKNPQHAFLRKGSKAVGPVSQICDT